MTWIDVPKTFTVRPFSVGHTTSMIDLPQMSSGGLLPTGMFAFYLQISLTSGNSSNK